MQTCKAAQLAITKSVEDQLSYRQDGHIPKTIRDNALRGYLYENARAPSCRIESN